MGAASPAGLSRRGFRGDSLRLAREVKQNSAVELWSNDRGAAGVANRRFCEATVEGSPRCGFGKRIIKTMRKPAGWGCSRDRFLESPGGTVALCAEWESLRLSRLIVRC